MIKLTIGSDEAKLLAGLALGGPVWRADLKVASWSLARKILVPAGYAAVIVAKRHRPATYIAATEAGVDALIALYGAESIEDLTARIRERLLAEQPANPIEQMLRQLSGADDTNDEGGAGRQLN
jgi:hypothetical protein